MSLDPEAATAAAESTAEDTAATHARGKYAVAHATGKDADALTVRECATGDPLADSQASGRDQVDDGAVADLEVPELNTTYGGAQHRGRWKGSAADRPTKTSRRVASELLDMMPSLGSARSRTSGADVQWQLGELLKRLSVHEPQQKEHRFWSTQPVPSGPYMEGAQSNVPFEPHEPRESLKQEPYSLPKDFEWSLLDINDAEQKKELYKLLTLNYVEDHDSMFRFDYSAEFLEWALKPPGWKQAWHIGVRVASNKKLVAFIGAIPIELVVQGRQIQMVEINFLCVHKKLRTKRLAPVLIKEVTRRVKLEGIYQAVYTAGVLLPTPIATCRYYHRSLNPRKLLDVNFSRVPQHTTVARYLRRYKLPTTTSLPGLRPTEKKDVPAVRALLNKYLAKFPVRPNFVSDEEAEHWLTPRKGVVWSYVVEDPVKHIITDFISFYSLPSTVIGNKLHKVLNAAYVFYYATDVCLGAEIEGETARDVENPSEAVPELVARLRALVGDVLIMAKNLDFDVMNALELMDSKCFLEEHKFGPGDGSLNYYLYNWRTRPVANSGIGLMML